jgi:L-lactate dehydrogenase complex protein LldG
VSDARSEILARVRKALADVPLDEEAEDVAVTRDYRLAEERSGRAEIVQRFCEMTADYEARVHRTTASELASSLARLCHEGGLRRVVVPPELPREWHPDGVDLVNDHDLGLSELDAMDGVISGCAVAIAQTGTIVLDGGPRSGRRVITLMPDHHLCVVESDQIVGLVPEALARVGEAVRARRAPVTLVSGPSATSDIELDRVEGVHGPRKLHVVVVEPG